MSYERKKRALVEWGPHITAQKTLELRRGYQRTKNDENLRQQRRLQYREGNRLYQEQLLQAKLNSWKDLYFRTKESNPWDAVYRLATGKLQNKNTLSTLKTPDGTYTTDIVGTVNPMMDHFIPEDNEGRWQNI